MIQLLRIIILGISITAFCYPKSLISENQTIESIGKIEYYKLDKDGILYDDIGNEFSRPDEQTINRFIGVLHKNQRHYQTLVRWSKGVDIDAACGQLSTTHND